MSAPDLLNGLSKTTQPLLLSKRKAAALLMPGPVVLRVGFEASQLLGGGFVCCTAPPSQSTSEAKRVPH